MITKGDLRKLARMVREDADAVFEAVAMLKTLTTAPKPRKARNNVGGQTRRNKTTRRRRRRGVVSSNPSANA